ncbi:MAG TPA: hypothetical protein PLQ20_00760 [Candidatus Paceibacterota bacterium]|nr:hypothetical protein [Candidatus Paceibacterota bacterium]
MDIIDNLIKEVNNPKPQSKEESVIIEVKKFVSLGYFFVSLWIVLLTVAMIFAEIKGDESVGFGVFLFSIGLSALSEIIGAWLFYRKSMYNKKIQPEHFVLKRLKVVATILVLSPLLFTLLLLILSSIFEYLLS